MAISIGYKKPRILGDVNAVISSTLKDFSIQQIRQICPEIYRIMNGFVLR